MASEAPPTYNTKVFNQAYWDAGQAGTIDTSYLNAHYLKFPTSQTYTETVYNLATTTDAAINSITIGRGNSNSITNTALGYLSLKDNTNGSSTGYSNTAVGSYSLTANTTGIDNTAIGADASKYNTVGSSNTSLGSHSLSLNSASNNTAIGKEALYSNDTGSNNTAVGSISGYGNGSNPNITGSNNTYIGYNTGCASTNLSNSTAIGSGATITASNQIVLGTSTNNIIQQGGYVMRAVSISGNTTLGLYDYNIIANVSSATLTITLPLASTVGQIIFIGVDSNATITRSGSDIIRLQGSPSGVTQPIYEYTSINMLGSSKYVLVSDGSTYWNVVSIWSPPTIPAGTTLVATGYPPIIFIGATVTAVTLPDKPYMGYSVTVRKTGASTSSVTISTATGVILTTTASASTFTMGTTIYSVTFAIRSANGGAFSWYVISQY